MTSNTCVERAVGAYQRGQNSGLKRPFSPCCFLSYTQWEGLHEGRVSIIPAHYSDDQSTGSNQVSNVHS